MKPYIQLSIKKFGLPWIEIPEYIRRVTKWLLTALINKSLSLYVKS